LFVACSYDGEIVCCDCEWNAVSNKLVIPDGEKLSHAAVARDGRSLIVTCGGSAPYESEYDRSMIGVIAIEHLQNTRCGGEDGDARESSVEFQLKLEYRLTGQFEFAEFVHESNQYIYIVCHTSQNGVWSQLYERVPVGESGHVEYAMIQRVGLNERGPGVAMVQPNEDNSMAAIAFSDRSVSIVDMKSMEVISHFQCLGSSAIRCLIFENNCIYTKSQTRTLDEWKIDYNSKTVSLLRSYNTAFSTVYMFCWDDERKDKMWLMTDHSLHLYDTVTQKDESVSFHSLTCCGIDFSPDGKYLVTGDFCGNVFVWDMTSHPHQIYEFSQSTNVFMSVRALKCKWSRTGDDQRVWLDVFVGTMDGNVFCWKVNLMNPEETQEPERIFALQDSITCLELQHGDDPSLLAVGTSDGMLCVMERPRPGEGSLMRIKLAIVAHRPITDNTDLRFGSINKYSEVWSVSWSPCNNYIVTASEDQTCSIWNLYGEKMHSLTGHTTAVTAVEWRKIPSLGEVLITIADDRNVMVWRLNTPQNIHYHHHQQIASRRPDHSDQEGSTSKYIDKKNKWGLYHIFTTEGFGLDWHTLTYMCVERSKNDRIAVATQNGYVFVWDIKTKQLVSRYKRHNASIEGMAWSDDEENNYLATCSSDCTINVYCMLAEATVYRNK